MRTEQLTIFLSVALVLLYLVRGSVRSQINRVANDILSILEQDAGTN